MAKNGRFGAPGAQNRGSGGPKPGSQAEKWPQEAPRRPPEGPWDPKNRDFGALGAPKSRFLGLLTLFLGSLGTFAVKKRVFSIASRTQLYSMGR
jgi:hypothetical protein